MRVQLVSFVPFLQISVSLDFTAMVLVTSNQMYRILENDSLSNKMLSRNLACLLGFKMK